LTGRQQLRANNEKLLIEATFCVFWTERNPYLLRAASFRIISIDAINVSSDAVAQGLMDSARHVIKRFVNPRPLGYMASYDAAITVHLVLATSSTAFLGWRLPYLRSWNPSESRTAIPAAF
jgi:hypothetical protein